MSSMWNKTLFYLGLVDEEEQGTAPTEAEQETVRQVGGDQSSPSDTSRTAGIAKPGSAIAGRRVEPPASSRRNMSSDPRYAEAGVYIHPTAEAAAGRVTRRAEPESHIIATRNFSDAQALADGVRAGRSVVLDLRSTEPEMVRRIVDFASGLTYALEGKMSKTSQGVIIVTPPGVVLGVNEQERLARLGLFDANE